MEKLFLLINPNLVQSLFTAIFGLIGVLIGSWLAWNREQKRARTNLVFDFQREYDSGEVCVARAAAHELLIKHPNIPLSELNDAADSDDTRNIWVLLNFYHRLWLSIEYKRIDRNLVFPLFGESIMWWNEVHFKDRTQPGDRDAIQSVAHLIKWFKKEYGRQPKHQEWQERALAAKANLCAVKDE